MPIYEYTCPEHDTFEVWMTKYEPPESAPCPKLLYEGGEGDDGEIMPGTEVRCNEDSPRKLSPLAGALGMPTGARRGG